MSCFSLDPYYNYQDATCHFACSVVHLCKPTSSLEGGFVQATCRLPKWLIILGRILRATRSSWPWNLLGLCFLFGAYVLLGAQVRRVKSSALIVCYVLQQWDARSFCKFRVCGAFLIVGLLRWEFTCRCVSALQIVHHAEQMVVGAC